MMFEQEEANCLRQHRLPFQCYDRKQIHCYNSYPRTSNSLVHKEDHIVRPPRNMCLLDNNPVHQERNGLRQEDSLSIHLEYKLPPCYSISGHRMERDTFGGSKGCHRTHCKNIHGKRALHGDILSRRILRIYLRMKSCLQHK